MVATRVSDAALKRMIKHDSRLAPQLGFKGPSGSLTLYNSVTRTTASLAGGIGITPFRSIVFRTANEKFLADSSFATLSDQDIRANFA